MRRQNHEDVSMLPDGRDSARLKALFDRSYCWWQTIPCGWSIDCETLLSSCSPGAWNQ